MLSFVELVARSIETQTEVLLEIAVQRWLAVAADATTHQHRIHKCTGVHSVQCSPAVIVWFGSFDSLCKLRCDADERFSPTVCGRISIFLFSFSIFIDIKVYRLSVSLRKGRAEALCAVIPNTEVCNFVIVKTGYFGRRNHVSDTINAPVTIIRFSQNIFRFGSRFWFFFFSIFSLLRIFSIVSFWLLCWANGAHTITFICENTEK